MVMPEILYGIFYAFVFSLEFIIAKYPFNCKEDIVLMVHNSYYHIYGTQYPGGLEYNDWFNQDIVI